MQEVETRYEVLSKLKENKEFLTLIKKGIISLAVSTKLQVYEMYLQEKSNNQTSIAVLFTAEHFEITEGYVYKIIRYMQS